MTTVKKLREIDNGLQAEYHLNPPITVQVLDETWEVSHLISSHFVKSWLMDDETMIFQSDGNGNVTRYIDLHYMPGHINHDEAVKNFLKGSGNEQNSAVA